MFNSRTLLMVGRPKSLAGWKRFYTAQSSIPRSSSQRNRVMTVAATGGVAVALGTWIYTSYSPKRTISMDSKRQMNNQPRQKGKELVTLFSDEEVNQTLRACQQSYMVNHGTGIYRYDISQLPSNNPIEDNHSEQILQLNHDQKDDDLYFFGIYDGHSGPFTSAKLAQSLIPHVAKNIVKNKDQQKLDTVIKESFVNLDNQMVIESFRNLFADPMNRENIRNIMPAISGSCALLSIYDSQSKNLKVAVTGDSRALIIGQQTNGNSKEWFVKSCSIDQTGDNLEEVQRIRKEHPKEPNVIARGRVLGGLQPSRAFGDYRYKLNKVDGKALSTLPDYLGIYLRSEPRNFLTPPYVTARPEITTTNIDSNIKMMVMGSDGLFELLSNEQIGALAVKWLEYNQQGSKDTTLPTVNDISLHKEAQRPAFRYKDEGEKGSINEKSRYLMEDSNIATYLIRNALSAGGRKEYVSTLVSIPPPVSRKYRDDLTVTVVFFGDNDEKIASKTLTINQEATTPHK